MSLLNDDKGIRVDIDYQIFQLCHLALLDGGENDFCIIFGVVTLAVQVSNAPVQGLADGIGDCLVVFADDQGYLGVVETVDHSINDLTADIDGDQGIEHVGDITEHDTGQGGDRNIQCQGDLANGDVPVFLLQQADHDV